MVDKRTKDIIDKYSRKLESQISTSAENDYSQAYSQFKEDSTPTLSGYEKWSNSLGNFLKIKIAEKDRQKIQGKLDSAHLEVSASQAITLSVVSLIGCLLITLLISVAAYLITSEIPILFAILATFASFFVFYYTYTMPSRIESKWKLLASSQMVPAILYVVVYMKHTSNLERAIAFASEHLEGPLAEDFKKIFYDVEIGKYSTIKQALDIYLKRWRFYAPEFAEAFHLIESSLYEPTEARRVLILEKSLQTILDGVYEKMLKYSREIRSPLTNIYMLGIILPTLGLALLPLGSTLLGGILKWYHVFILFNLIIPFFVFYMTSQVLLKRPGGYGETSVLELNPEYSTFKSKKPWILATIIAIPLLLIGLSPFILQTSFVTDTLNLPSDFQIPFIDGEMLFNFQGTGSERSGPFSPLSVMLSLTIPLSIALFFSIAYKAKTRTLIDSRNKTKKLEKEFTNTLFQLGNRLGDGIPAEIAFGKVAESTQGLATHSFFSIVNHNVQQLGMSVESAIFNKKQGAITYYPSALIATSMRILIESSKKGLGVASKSLMSISDYIKNIEKINQRLRDLLAEIVSDMKSNMVFLAPLLSGIVVGLSTMITIILLKLQSIQVTAESGSAGGFGSLASTLSIFDVTGMIPPYFTQVSIGIYIIEIIFILTGTLVTVDAGTDKLREKNELSSNLKKGVFLYLLTALASVIALTALSLIALSTL